MGGILFSECGRRRKERKKRKSFSRGSNIYTAVEGSEWYKVVALHGGLTRRYRMCRRKEEDL